VNKETDLFVVLGWRGACWSGTDLGRDKDKRTGHLGGGRGRNGERDNETDLLELGGDEPVSGIVRQASWVCGNETGLLEPGRVCGNETGLLEPGNETGLLEPGYAAFLQNAGLGRGGTQSVALGWYTVSRWDTGRR
jgi:hypothetical protein